ncbi:MAG: branched-chain amino acid ABC transporter permease [Microcella pacifica]
MTITDIINITVVTVFTIQIALGLLIIFGVMKVINMAHGEFFMLGAYTMVVTTSLGINPWLGIIIASALLAGFGMLVERLMIRPIYGRADLSSLLVTFGLSIVLQQTVRLVFGPQPLTVPNPVEGTVDILGTAYPSYRLIAAAIALVVTIGLALLLFRSVFGIRLRATISNTEVASALGTNTGLVGNLTFGLGAGLAGLAGALMAPFVGVVSTMGLDQTVRSFLVVITGGLGSLGGTVGGGVLIGGGQSAMSVWFDGTIAQVAVLLLAMIVMLLRPRGLFAGKARSF